jgi:hypothetical protein
MIIRRINCLRGEYQSIYPPAYSSTYVKATSRFGTTEFWEYFACDPSKSLTGTRSYNSWEASNETNQRFHIDLGEMKLINRVYYENFHDIGTLLDRGAKNFTMWGSNSATAFAELTYAIDTDWTQITTNVTQFEQHVALDQSDPHYIISSPISAYRYYAFKIADAWEGSYMGLRRIELQEML